MVLPLRCLAMLKISKDCVDNLFNVDLEPIVFTFLPDDIQLNMFGCVMKSNGRVITHVKMVYKDETINVGYKGDSNAIKVLPHLYPRKWEIKSPTDNSIIKTIDWAKYCGLVDYIISDDFIHYLNDFQGISMNVSCTHKQDGTIIADDGFYMFKQDGSIEVEGSFRNGKFEYNWKRYDNNGNIIMNYEFNNGEYVGKNLVMYNATLTVEYKVVDNIIESIKTHTNDKRKFMRNFIGEEMYRTIPDIIDKSIFRNLVYVDVPKQCQYRYLRSLKHSSQP
jgi:hypothetical protein